MFDQSFSLLVIKSARSISIVHVPKIVTLLRSYRKSSLSLTNHGQKWIQLLIVQHSSLSSSICHEIILEQLFYIVLGKGRSLSKIKVCCIEIKKMLWITIWLLASHSWSQVHVILLRHWLSHTRIHARISLLARIHVHSMTHCWILCHSIDWYLLIRILRILSIVNRLLIIIVRIVCHIIKLIILL